LPDVAPVAHSTGGSCSATVSRTVGGEKLFGDGVSRVNFQYVGDVEGEPFAYSEQMTADEWQRGGFEQRAEAMHTVEQIPSERRRSSM
jgi:hypothetical protein